MLVMRPRRTRGATRRETTVAGFLSYLRLARLDPVQQRPLFYALS